MRALFAFRPKTFSPPRCRRLTLGEKQVASHEVLLLNSNYEPLNVCNLRRAVSLLLLGKAEILQHREHPMATVRGEYKAPSVLKMRYQVRRPMPQLRLSRHSILARDQYTCQYCGAKNKDLTLDHVTPRWAGGQNTWDNLVACCRRCNLKKADKTPAQAHMKLARPPKRPHFIPYLSLPLYLKAQGRDEWRMYLPYFEAFGGHFELSA
jgi:5-methylcytosine-specific restriction endonuclease McrA